KLFAAVLGDLLRPPRRHPDPVDAEVVDELARALQHRRRLVLDDVRQRAGRRGQRHVDGGGVVGLDPDVVDQAQVDDVHAQLGVDHHAHGLLAVVDLRHALGPTGRALRRLGLLRLLLEVGRRPALALAVRLGHAPTSLEFDVRASASLNAIHPSNAHFTRAGYLATPANAMPSSRTSSSGSTWPRPCMSSVNASIVVIASSMLWPTTRSVSTDVDAWLIEQPCPS